MFLVAAWAIVTRVFEILAAVDFRGVIEDGWQLIVAGILSVVFGVLLIVFPGAGAISLVWLIGLYAMIAGILDIVFAFRLHNLVNKVQKSFGTGNA